jgi:hypothetical protein
MKFCGMCGATLPAALAEEPASMPARILPADDFADSEVAAAQRPATPSAPAPAHTGGAFRLMGQDVEPGTRSLDYLLEDDEEAGSGGRGWLLGIVLALALAGGLGYWHYRNGGWSAAKPATGASTNTPSGAGSNPSDNPEGSAAAPAAATSASSTNSAPAAGGASSPATAALTEVRPQNPAEAPVANSDATAKPDVVVTAPPTATKKPAQEPDATAVPTKPTRAARPEAPVKAEDPVTLGEKYIYGRGVPQSCDRGLKMVKPAADQSNGKAMITMGALYATGHCVTRDLPTAYRYFALALRKDPENAALKQNAEMVWGQMTQSERQQAIRLTQ